MPTSKKQLEWIPTEAPCPFENAAFWDLWVNLLSSPKWKKKPLSSIQLACNKLKRYDVDFAASLVENAIIGNYQGVVFTDTDQRYENWKFTKQKQNGQSAREKTGEVISIVAGRTYPK